MTAPHTLLNAWQIKAKKQLGQNFLRRAEVAEKIVTAARLKPDDTVVEIGAGLGALTIPAARKAGLIYAVETDRRIAGLLKTEILTAGVDNVDIIETDILNLDLKNLSAGSDSGLVVIGNLPYNISSQILIKDQADCSATPDPAGRVDVSKRAGRTFDGIARHQSVWTNHGDAGLLRHSRSPGRYFCRRLFSPTPDRLNHPGDPVPASTRHIPSR